jgi:phosphoglycolate phosphatase-like HAD superfamily hydrolase
VKVVIFDFDQILVDMRPVARLRSARNWTAVMAQAYRLNAYNGINDLLSKLHRRGQTLAIVTNAPDMVPKVFINRYKWPIEIVVGFHSVTKCEPDPERLMLAMAIADAHPEDTFNIGAYRENIMASRSTNVSAIGCTWGLTDVRSLQSSNPDHLFGTVDELRSFLLPRKSRS